MVADLESIQKILGDHALKIRKRIKHVNSVPAFSYIIRRNRSAWHFLVFHEISLGYFFHKTTRTGPNSGQTNTMVTTMTIKECNVITLQCVYMEKQSCAFCQILILEYQ